MSLKELREILNLDVCENTMFEYLSPQDIVLFGASGGGKDVLKVLSNKGVNIKCFCDNDEMKWGKEIDGIPVISPQQLYMEPKDILIMISSMYVHDIDMQLKKEGFKNIDNMFRCLDIDHSIKCAQDKNKLIDSRNEIENAYNILYDEKSKKVFKNLLKHRYTNESHLLYEIEDSLINQYFDSNIIKLSEEEVFVDGGCFDGQTTTQFKKLVKNKFEKIYIFEPDKYNFTQIKRNIDFSHDEKIILIQKALYNRQDTLNFSHDNSVGSAISFDGEGLIEADRLDNLIDEKVTFLKMDIEGAEIPALEGAENIIKKYTPKLAICVYHKYDDLFKIPLLLNKFNKNYKLYLRHYSPYYCETVCYAVVE